VSAPIAQGPAQLGRHLLELSAFFSGAAALTLELQWGRQLALVFGSSHNAVAAVLTAFMLGLGIGGVLGGRAADRLARPALAVAAIELVLSATGPLLAWLLVRSPSLAANWLPNVADATDPLFVGSRLMLALAIVLLPTTLIGATFPILVRAAAVDLEAMHHGIGRLYAAGTIGGVSGALTAGLVVVPEWGIPGSIAAASGANLVAGIAAFAAGRRLGEMRTSPGRSSPAAIRLSRLLAAAAGSGALVLGAETLWYRALKLVLTNSTTTLTLLLALTLAGLGIGALIGTPLLAKSHPLLWWARLQLTAVLLFVAQAALLPEIATMVRWLRPDNGWLRVFVPPLAVGGVLIVPATMLFGAAWPLLLKAATPSRDDGGLRIGRMALANSVGAALGAALVGLVVLPNLGFGRSMLAAAALAAALPVLGLSHESGGRTRILRRLRVTSGCGGIVLVTAATMLSSFGRVPLPSTTAAGSHSEIVRYHESAAGTVVVTEDRRTGARAMYVDNNAVIGTTYDALQVVRMLGLVPTLLHSSPEHLLVIGFGAGVTTATAAATPGVVTIDVVEIVPGVVSAAPVFEHVNHGIHNDSRIRIHPNDGRNHLLLHPGPFDVITCDPVHPLYGSAPLYSLEFFRLCRSRLAPGGIVCQYLPLHRMPEDAFRRAIATFQKVFPNSWVLFGLGHAMLVGGDEPLTLDWRRWQDVLDSHPLRDDLAASALARPAQIAALLLLDPEGCRNVGRGELSTDLHPRLEFLAPAAYQKGLWPANARMLVEAYISPLDRIEHLPPGMEPHLQRLIAGKRLLLFSLLERSKGDFAAAEQWLHKAMQIAGDDPEVVHYGRQLAAESRERAVSP
jgi:spermidine synthase